MLLFGGIRKELSGIRQLLEQIQGEQKHMSTSIAQLATDFAAFQTAFGTFATDFATFAANTQAALAALANAGEDLTAADQASVNAIDTGLTGFASQVAQMDATVKGITFPPAPAPPPAPSARR
jgi:DNA anti-recombination protein RmuC